MPKLTNKQMSREHEDYIAVVFDGDREPASGASITNPGDVFVREGRSDYGVPLLFECKVSETGRVSISGNAIHKIQEEAAMRGARPMIALRLRDPYTGKHVDWIMKTLADELEDRAKLHGWTRR